MRAPPESFESDHRCPDLHGVVHDLADLLGMGFGERAAEDREILAEDEHDATVDRAIARDDAVARHALFAHAEVDATMLDEHVPLFERAGIHQELDPFASGEFALGMLGFDTALAAAHFGGRSLCRQFSDDVLHGE